MPQTRAQFQSGVWNDISVRPTPSQSKARLQALDLEDYVPLGSFVAGSTHHLTSLTTQNDTIEVQENPSSLLAGNLNVAENLNLLWLHHWIRMFVKMNSDTKRSVLRIYVLPDDVAPGLVVRDSAKLRSALRHIISVIDCSSDAWNGLQDSMAAQSQQSYIAQADVTDSLYYLFNNVTSPQPDPESLQKDTNYYAMQDILNQPLSFGLKTTPYDYQQRSAAAMLSREAEPQYHIDPRVEKKQNPIGDCFYLDCIEGTINKEAKSYEDVRGGILAENMGSGKTFTSLILTLSTKGHIAKPPITGIKSSSFDEPRHIEGTRSLLETAGRAIRQHNVSYKYPLAKASHRMAEYVESLTSWYVSSNSDEARIHPSSTTLIVAPPNLISHWTDEIQKHVISGELSVYTTVNDSIDMPSIIELLKYDVILISKARFEDEFSPRRSMKRQRDEDENEGDGVICTCNRKRRACGKHPYNTPLANIHFLRVIVDEALGFSKSAFDNKASAALEKLIVERKWLVSGTPSKGIRGVEIDMAMNQDHNKGADTVEQETVEQGRARPTMETEEEQVKRFGYIVTNFFRAKPWSNKGYGSHADKASWTRYMIPDKYGKGKPGNLQAVIESLVVRHQIHEVSKEVQLPPLSNRVIYLDASPIDKMTLNLFTVQLVINAITSEREDQDYMFHPKQKTSLARLFQNLRHANFYWVGLNSADFLKAIEIAERYAAKDTTRMSAADDELLKKAVSMGRRALDNIQWQTISGTKELGLFVQDFPNFLRERWGLSASGYRQPLLMGATSLQTSQKEILPKLYAQDPFNILWRSEGDEIWREAVVSTVPEKKSKAQSVKGISQSTYDTQDVSSKKRAKVKVNKSTQEISSLLPKIEPRTNFKSALKRSNHVASLPEAYKEISKPRLVATSSAKLSYLIDKIMAVQQEEKSIIFYEDPNAGYWLAQALEILDVKHEIYASGIKESLRTQYLNSFENGDEIRVLLMDLKLGSHGLHLASVTRVFFVNPVWDETVEAQAIKRAHRTGQTKPVYIETLVLKGTLEDQMLQRRKNMTSQELQQTSKGPTSDPEMHAIIQNVQFLPISEKEWTDENIQRAPLKKAYQIYGREFINHPNLTPSSSRESSRPATPVARTIRFAEDMPRPDS